MKTLLRALAGRTERYARVVSGHVCKHVYGNDLEDARAIARGYWIGGRLNCDDAQEELRALQRSLPGFGCHNYLARLHDVQSVPFVYETPDAPHLSALRRAFDLPGVIADAADEYDAMLRLGTWLGSRWDHGTDTGSWSTDLVRIIREGMQGRKYSCELASRVAVQAFAAMGWPARLVGASRYSHLSEHGVMEVWSNQFAKWFAMDVDFNVVYESDGIPISACELCHDGPALRSSGKLHERLLGQSKPGLPLRDLVPFYACIFIDLRSDWYTRRLKRGSPAGGDLSSWWTARADTPAVLTPKVRVDDRRRFDWPVNIAWVRLQTLEPVTDQYSVTGRIHGYSPSFKLFQISVNDQSWRDVQRSHFALRLPPGTHTIAARLITSSGGCGMTNKIDLVLP